jgi:hypothetical protein
MSNTTARKQDVISPHELLNSRKDRSLANIPQQSRTKTTRLSSSALMLFITRCNDGNFFLSTSQNPYIFIPIVMNDTPRLQKLLWWNARPNVKRRSAKLRRPTRRIKLQRKQLHKEQLPLWQLGRLHKTTKV